MDPFSIIVGTTGLTDVIVRCFQYLKSIKSASTEIQNEITDLDQEITNLVAVVESVKSLQRPTDDPVSLDTTSDDVTQLDNAWKHLANFLDQSKAKLALSVLRRSSRKLSAKMAPLSRINLMHL